MLGDYGMFIVILSMISAMQYSTITIFTAKLSEIEIGRHLFIKEEWEREPIFHFDFKAYSF